jgi:hypothetical protein
MNKISEAEILQLIAILRDLKPYETVEIKRDDKGNLQYIHTKKEKYTFGEK